MYSRDTRGGNSREGGGGDRVPRRHPGLAGPGASARRASAGGVGNGRDRALGLCGCKLRAELFDRSAAPAAAAHEHKGALRSVLEGTSARRAHGCRMQGRQAQGTCDSLPSVSTGRGTRRVHLVRGEGRDVST